MRIHKIKLLGIFILLSTISFAQLPSKVLVGYWENWGTLRLKDIDERYNVICLAFLEADKNLNKLDNKVSDLEFTANNNNALKSDIPIVQSKGAKVLLSIGGGNGSFKLNNLGDKNIFVSRVKDFINEYGVDGIDIDLEQGTYICPSNNQNLSTPESHIQYLIDACKELLTWYDAEYGKKMILTTAPEVAYTIGGTSPWNDCNGALLPFIEVLRNDIDLLMIQLYNSGDIYSKAGWPASSATYKENTSDFVIVATESAIEGFTLPNQLKTKGVYSGFPAEKVVVGLTTCANDEAVRSKSQITSIIKYLMGSGTKPGNYTLQKTYPNLKGLMTWSINIDAQMSSSSSCNPSKKYEYAQTFEDIFGTINNSRNVLDVNTINAYPNPTTGLLTIKSDNLEGKLLILVDINGKEVLTFKSIENQTTIDLSSYSKGVYTLKSGNYFTKIVIK